MLLQTRRIYVGNVEENKNFEFKSEMLQENKIKAKETLNSSQTCCRKLGTKVNKLGIKASKTWN